MLKITAITLLYFCCEPLRYKQRLQYPYSEIVNCYLQTINASKHLHALKQGRSRGEK